jgi:hypothetical protein
VISSSLKQWATNVSQLSFAKTQASRRNFGNQTKKWLRMALKLCPGFAAFRSQARRSQTTGALAYATLCRSAANR